MKIVSLKTFLAAVFIGIPFVVWNIVRRDIIWIGISVYLLISGFRCSFSQEAYDADIKKAADMKQMYREIFGRFAPVAPNIPMILLLLCAAMVYIFPVTKLMRIIVGVVCFLIIAYALWFWWIVSKYKHKQPDSEIKEQSDEK